MVTLCLARERGLPLLSLHAAALHVYALDQPRLYRNVANKKKLNPVSPQMLTARDSVLKRSVCLTQAACLMQV